jgi:type VI secretion system protein ImpH
MDGVATGDFFAALRELSRRKGKSARFGYSLIPQDDPIRLGQQPTLGFVPSEIHSISDNTDPPKLLVYFTGLFGPHGPMPLHITEQALKRLRQDADSTLCDFADIFHHRILSLLFRAWADVRPEVALDDQRNDRFGIFIRALMGMLDPPRRQAFTDMALRYYAGWMVNFSGNAEGLRRILGDFLKVPIALELFEGEWLEIQHDDRLFLGDRKFGLGQQTNLGGFVWNRSSKVEIAVGPIGLAEYERFLPGGGSLQALREVVETYLPAGLHWQLRLWLDSKDAWPARLDGQSRLGQSAWLSPMASTVFDDFTLSSHDMTTARIGGRDG